MTKLIRPIYNSITKFYHRVLKVPVRLKVAAYRKVKNPQLVVILLHGIAATSDTWNAAVEYMKGSQDFDKVEIVALDLLGFGRSLKADWLDYDYLDYEKALDEAIQRLKIKAPVVLIGHSMGALIAAHYATHYSPSANIAQLILVSPPVLMASELAKLPDKAYTTSYRSLHRIAKNMPAAEIVGRIAQKFSSFKSGYVKTMAFSKSMEQIILNHQNYQTFLQLRTPTTILHGYFDPLVISANLRRIANHNSHIKYQSVLGHHDISSAKRAKIMEDINEVLQNNAKS